MSSVPVTLTAGPAPQADPAALLAEAAKQAGLVPEGAACPAGPVVPRPGWPPLPGDYTVLRYAAPAGGVVLPSGAITPGSLSSR